MKKVSDIKQRIEQLKKELNAVVVAHNYQRPEVQDIADFVGDSLELARKCTEVEAEVIVFCGVHFMAESAAILNPQKTVLLSEGDAGCPMADMMTGAQLREWKAKYPNATVVCYINSTAEVKSESDYCCTSANAVKLTESIPDKDILFVPDKNLAHYVSTKTDKNVILYPGCCPPHDRVTPGQVAQARKNYPDAELVVHPECRPEVVALADAVLSTSQMIRHVKESSNDTFIIGTEQELMYRMKKDNPNKTFYVLSPSLICPNMKKTTINSVVKTMELKRNVVTVPEDIRIKAKRSLDRMLAVV
ncbi:MAG: quinolinate synthase NadA [Chloroflexi bacterium]|nr:quinolinate synthase NadA [Chloroflexota bacterium]MBT7080835.1 quinolinate synthase NadA [Chloroflexota bacterium]